MKDRLRQVLDRLKIASEDSFWVFLIGSWFACLSVSLFLFTGQGEFQQVVAHRLGREFLHLVSAPFVYIGLMWGFWVLDRKTASIEIKGWRMYIVPGGFGTILIAALEWAGPGWVGVNGSANDRFKSVIDCLQWAGAYGLTGWALYRLTPLLSRVLIEIQESRSKA